MRIIKNIFLFLSLFTKSNKIEHVYTINITYGLDNKNELNQNNVMDKYQIIHNLSQNCLNNKINKTYNHTLFSNHITKFIYFNFFSIKMLHYAFISYIFILFFSTIFLLLYCKLLENIEKKCLYNNDFYGLFMN
jgi:hypothetical protein